MQDPNAVPAAGPATDGPDPGTRITGQDPAAAFRRPDDVEPVVMNAVGAEELPRASEVGRVRAMESQADRHSLTKKSGVYPPMRIRLLLRGSSPNTEARQTPAFPRFRQTQTSPNPPL